jgi:transcriptional regulator with GAF, ATPase, and Fis domain
MFLLDSSSEDDDDTAIVFSETVRSYEPDYDRRIAFRLAWKQLGPELRLLWKALDEENGNQVQVARRLGLHRNTIRFRVKKLQNFLKRHGFSGKTNL